MACGGAGVDGRGTLLRLHDQTQNRSLNFRDLLLAVPVINARFFRRAVGSFDMRQPIVADHEFLLRAALVGETTTTIDDTIYTYTLNPGSPTIGGKD